MDKPNNEAMLKRLKDNRMYRIFSDLRIRSEEIQNEDGTTQQEMIVEGQAVTFESETVLFLSLIHI